ncbi:hypothetical protein [Amycolatopsis sp. NPDC051061]|uniref:NACHT domain-containing protein n=1 Tax=Amycolatopsis sp. NPDC051061 TaxID=3155042 RepID=UPI00343B78C0
MLKSRYPGKEVSAAVDALSGALIVLSPLILGINPAPVLAFIGAKNEILKAGNLIVRKLARSSINSDLTRHELLSSAYCTICFTAFFEAIDNFLPGLRKQLGLLPSDTLTLTYKAAREIAPQASNKEPAELFSLSDWNIALPHPTDTLEQNGDILERLYGSMAKEFSKLIQQLSYWEDIDETAKEKVAASIRELPKVARNMYKGQYLALCTKFSEFEIWANLHEHTVTRQRFDALATDTKIALELALKQQERNATIDVGLKSIEDALTEVVHISSSNLDGILDGLSTSYKSEVELPVIDDTYSSIDGVDLKYPRKSEIFVPQAFRAIRYRKEVGQLENESLWQQNEVVEDIGRYILNNLSSPYSIESPLIILGQPGSGKSLLTEMLAARLASPEYNPIRVELRDINPDSDIQTQIEEQIRAETGREANWAELVGHCSGRPPLVILDGYDELLQASGKVFSTYLMSVANFQRRERVQGRPVRIIVTSRVTLIDKAEIPFGATIIRLEEFDDKRMRLWTSIWNRVNSPYFLSRDVSPFSLPADENLLSLASQPLLLLMLALYDSESNRLSKSGAIDQTVLYYSLLNRFILRERMKGDDGAEFRALPEAERDLVVSADLKRLGVAAIGMLNRRSLNITKSALDNDLKYFDLLKSVKPTSGVQLGQAELLLGSFFFVHESRSKILTEPRAKDSVLSAFEFLHNTFGEFLAAEWIVSTVIGETEVIRHLRSEPSLATVLHQRLENKDGLPNSWFATLMATPLFGRPVVLSMIREWIVHRLRYIGRTLDEFTIDLETIFYSQARRILSSSNLPEMLLGGEETPFPRGSVLANLATYTLNLVLLRCTIGSPFSVDLNRLSSDNFPKPWANIIDLWRAGLGQDALMGISAIISSHVDSSGITLSSRVIFGSTASQDQLSGLYDLATSVGDDLLATLTGWALQDVKPLDPPNLNTLAEMPAFLNTAFNVEISARRDLRAHYSNGYPKAAPIQDGPHDQTASSYRLRVLDGRISRDRSEELDQRILLGENTELAMDLICSYPVFHSFDLSEDEYDMVVLERTLVAAEAIARFYDYERCQFRPYVDSGINHFSKAVTAAAVRLAKTEIKSFPPEVGYELIASDLLDDTGLEKHKSSLLGTAAPIWAIASRRYPTILRLLNRSERDGRLDWVHQVIRGFSEIDGPSLVTSLGAASTIALLRYGRAEDLARSEVQSRPDGSIQEPAGGVQGIVAWTMKLANPYELHFAIAELVKLLEASNRSWLRHLGMADLDTREYLQGIAQSFSSSLPASILASIDSLLSGDKLPRRRPNNQAK